MPYIKISEVEDIVGLPIIRPQKYYTMYVKRVDKNSGGSSSNSRTIVRGSYRLLLYYTFDI